MANLLPIAYLEVTIAEVRRTLEQTFKYMDTADPNISRVNKLVEQLEKAYDHFNSSLLIITQNHFTDVLKVENYESWSATQNIFKVNIIDQLSKISDRQKLLNDAVNVTTHTSTTPKIKYPEIQLVKFFGDKTKWDTWWQGYSSMVHSKRELDAITKYTYLLTTLEGEAHKSVE